jgi:hypothetical protein
MGQLFIQPAQCGNAVVPANRSPGSRGKRTTAGRWIIRLTALATAAVLYAAVLGAQQASAGAFCPIGTGRVTLWNPSGSTEPWSCTRWQSGLLAYSYVEYNGQGSPYDNGCAGSRTGQGDFQHIDNSVQAYVCGGNVSATCGGGCGTSISVRYYPFIKNSGGGQASTNYWGYYN